MNKRDHERRVLRNITRGKNDWMRRAFMMSEVLEYLGYSTGNIMQTGGEILANGVLKDAKAIVRDFQMGGPDDTQDST